MGARDRWPALQFFFQPGDTAEFFQSCAVVNCQQRFLIEGGDMFNRNFNAVDRTEDAAAEFFQSFREVLDLVRGSVKQSMETVAKRGIVGRESGQYSGMVNRFVRVMLSTRGRAG